MNTAKPIKNKDDIIKFKLFFIKRKEYRNYLLITIQLNTALKIGHILNLKHKDLYDYDNKRFKNHITVRDEKTRKAQEIYINSAIRDAFKLYDGINKCPDENIFTNKQGKPISRVQVYRIIKEAGEACNIGHLSCNSLRKTFGYYAWKKGAEPALLMEIFNHKSYNSTKRFLCISQEDKDNLFGHIKL
ncbi:MAG: tyrosine-type recombinase/integrase [Clostridia bacterium]|nr:tyrosine-type recombinase/integrase [Clostridia bacterium]